MIERLRYLLTWLCRSGHSRGFGIQSPSDYWLVRYVINEHWPYYQYHELGQHDDWLTQKVGRLCFRLANWRQPTVITSSAYREYLHGGCRKAAFGEGTELVVLALQADWRRQLAAVIDRADERTVLVVDDIRHHKAQWRELVADGRTVITFDLYYCGIVLFDQKRVKHHYIINF